MDRDTHERMVNAVTSSLSSILAEYHWRGTEESTNAIVYGITGLFRIQTIELEDWQEKARRAGTDNDFNADADD